MIVEPRIWSQVTDSLPPDHPLANQSVNCANCGEMVHCWNNENMQEWLETGKGPWCLECFLGAIFKVEPATTWTRGDGSTYSTPEKRYHEIEEEWGLPA